MQRLGRPLLVLGALLALIGLVGGFATMFNDMDQIALRLLGLVPVGFVLAFAGLALVVLFGPERR